MAPWAVAETEGQRGPSPDEGEGRHHPHTQHTRPFKNLFAYNFLVLSHSETLPFSVLTSTLHVRRYLTLLSRSLFSASFFLQLLARG